MTAADIAYVDHDPLIPTHLGTDAPHVHVRSTDRCLRRPEGVECLSPAELRAEVERLRGEVDSVAIARNGAMRERDRERAAKEGNIRALNASIARAESAEAERDSLQQRLNNVQALAESLSVNSHAIGDEGECTYCGVPKEECGVWLVLAALGGPAAPPRWDEETDALFVDAARRAAPPQEPQPTPEAGAAAFVTGTADWLTSTDPRLSEEAKARIIAARQSDPVEPNEGPQPKPEADEQWLARQQDEEPQPTPESRMPAPCATDGSCSWPSCICGADLDDEPVERITDANGDETERGADTDTDTENTHQQDADVCSTCGGSFDSPPCSLNRDLGLSGHTGGGGVQGAARQQGGGDPA